MRNATDRVYRDAELRELQRQGADVKYRRRQRWERFKAAVRKALAILVLGLLAGPAAASAGQPHHRVPLARATSMVRRFERDGLGLPPHRLQLHCWQGRRGNVGCVYQACVDLGNWSGSNGPASVNFDFGRVVVTGTAGVTWRRGRLRVLDSGWLHLGDRCGSGPR